jgi:glycosyltransferase involved in cell wall biosynthesis
MNVWLVTVGEPLPTDPGNNRLHRTGMLARYLCEAGHSVLWWTSTFDHFRRLQRFDSDQVVEWSSTFQIQLLHGFGYKRNVSVRRLVDHGLLGLRFARLAPTHGHPDVILASLPTLELAGAACHFGLRGRVPVVVDIRDLWPDVFLDVFPEPARWLARALLWPYRTLAKYCCAHATAIVGPTKEYVEWGLRVGRRKDSPLNQVFPFGYPCEKPSAQEVREAEESWSKRGLRREDSQFLVCFFGTLGMQFDLETVIRAAEILEKTHPRIRFVLCGAGDREGYYRELGRSCRNVVFPGWVEKAEIWVLMRMAAVGLAPYRSSANFTKNIANKPIEYLSGALPVITGLQGTLSRFLVENDCGVLYQQGDATSLANCLSALYHDPARLLRLRTNARAVFEARFRADRVYTSMVAHLERIATPHGGRVLGAGAAVKF